MKALYKLTALLLSALLLISLTACMIIDTDGEEDNDASESFSVDGNKDSGDDAPSVGDDDKGDDEDEGNTPSGGEDDTPSGGENDEGDDAEEEEETQVDKYPDGYSGWYPPASN